MFTAMRRASSRVSSLAADRRPTARLGDVQQAPILSKPKLVKSPCVLRRTWSKGSSVPIRRLAVFQINLNSTSREI
jgi:hypothetical protein